MWSNLQFPADLITFTEEILNGKLHYLCSVKRIFNKLARFLFRSRFNFTAPSDIIQMKLFCVFLIFSYFNFSVKMLLPEIALNRMLVSIATTRRHAFKQHFICKLLVSYVVLSTNVDKIVSIIDCYIHCKPLNYFTKNISNN